MQQIKKVTFGSEEVIAYLEDKIISDNETYEELMLYEDYQRYGTLNRDSTCRHVLRQMYNEYNGIYE